MPAQKKGEVVEPAGGGTGGPRCLAEDRSVASNDDNYYFKEQ